MLFPLGLAAGITYALTLFQFVYADLSYGFPYGTSKVRGVNLGGWLVLEPFITPSIFDSTADPRIVDEYTYGKYLNHTQALPLLKAHWDTFITEADFIAIAAAGLNHVRIPIGFWAFDLRGGEPYIQGQLPYLNKAVNWAEAHGLKVIVDLHGAPGSQNGFDNSGQKMPYPLWHTAPFNIVRTKDIIQTLGLMFRDRVNVVPIVAPLNEPAGFFGADVLAAVKQYWYDAYGIIRWIYGVQSSNPSNTVVLIHDAFQSIAYWKNFMPSPRWEGVIMDTHSYQMFSQGENAMTYTQHINTVCAKKTDLLTSTLPMMVGEFTTPANDCAKYLNGRGIGARYDGTYPGSTAIGSCTGLTGSAATFRASYRTFLRQYWEAQVITWESATYGWIHWTWKTESTDEWSYQAGLANGWIPATPGAYLYPNICDS